MFFRNSLKLLAKTTTNSGSEFANCINCSSSLSVAGFFAATACAGFEPPLNPAYAPRPVRLRVAMASLKYLLLIDGIHEDLEELELETAYDMRANLAAEKRVIFDHDGSM